MSFGNVKELMGRARGRTLACGVLRGRTGAAPLAHRLRRASTSRRCPRSRWAATRASTDAVDVAVERAYLTGIPHIAEGEDVTPAACIPLQLEDRIVGVIVVYTLLEHKKRFVTMDRELLKLLMRHAGAAVSSALYLWGDAGGRLTSAESLRYACA